MGDVHIPAGIICTPEQYNRVLAHDRSIHCLTRNESIALTIVTEVGFISLLAVCYVFFIITCNVVRHFRLSPKHRISVIQEPMDILMLSLFIADFGQAFGAVADIKWVNEGKVEIGAWCTAQGVFQQLGETGSAITTLLIAIYTFIGVWWRIGMGKKSVRVAKLIVGLMWFFIILMVTIGHATHADKRQFYEAPTPYWCWIGDDYLQWRLWGEYIWFWVTLAFSFFAYSLLFFWSRGNITINDESWWRFSVHHRQGLHKHHSTRLQSLIMLAYPIVYSILILPLSIVRWIGFVQERGAGVNRIGEAATMTVIAIYGCTGIANVVLLLTTRPNSVLFGTGLKHEPQVLAHGEVDSGIGHELDGRERSTSVMGMGRGVSELSGDDLGRLPSRSSAGSGWP
ncbi:hypothetical protein DXG01_002981 [Tephrocybe rancida]|nr:hypothetical protein DXG01_002981 [Tephrocybe rancida]